MQFDQIESRIQQAVGLELNKLKNHVRRMYALGEINSAQWEQLEKLVEARRKNEPEKQQTPEGQPRDQMVQQNQEGAKDQDG